MEYGFCNIAIAPLRANPNERAEQVSQLLFGDTFSIIEEIDNRFFIQNYEDGYNGWVDKKQVIVITSEEYNNYNAKEKYYTKEAISYITQTNILSKEKIIYPIYLGSQVLSESFSIGEIKFEILPTYITKPLFSNIMQLSTIAIKYISAPYLWGGKTIFGIDCSGFVQMCYRQIGIKLLRDTSEQITQGEEIDKIENALKGDLCFFANNENKVIHVGLYLEGKDIIHASGQVRVDKIDNYGIIHSSTKEYTHRLFKIKRII